MAGSLTIGDIPNGPAFEVAIEASRGKGINSMQIFCFDMMLTELSLRRQQHRGPGFLIHSHLFDGVDESLGIRGIGRTIIRSLNAQMFDRDLSLYGSVRDD